MAKIKIVKPTGSEEILGLVSAFTVEDNTFVIFDSEKTGSMGLPIIFVSKLNNEKLEKVNDEGDWEKAKSYLKGIIGGTNFWYINVADTLNADEAFYRPLTLPQASFDIIKSRYVVNDSNGNIDGGASIDIPLISTLDTLDSGNQNIGVDATNQSDNAVEANINSNISSEPVTIMPEATLNEPVSMPAVSPQVSVIPEKPIIPNNNNIASNSESVSAPISIEPTLNQVNEEVNIAKEQTQEPNITANNINEEIVSHSIPNNFDNDKETFLKACENMFDAIISKYQKKLAELEKREQILKQKEKEVDDKLHNASEHLANAEAREAVANIAHDNAKKVMDLASMMPINPEATETGVI